MSWHPRASLRVEACSLCRNTALCHGHTRSRRSACCCCSLTIHVAAPTGASPEIHMLARLATALSGTKALQPLRREDGNVAFISRLGVWQQRRDSAEAHGEDSSCERMQRSTCRCLTTRLPKSVHTCSLVLAFPDKGGRCCFRMCDSEHCGSGENTHACLDVVCAAS